MDNALKTDPDAEIFSVTHSTGVKAWLYIIGGIALLGFALLGFLLAIRLKAYAFQLQIDCTLPTMAAIGLFASAWRSLRAPQQICLTADGLTISRRGVANQYWPWEQIASAKTSAITLSKRRQITLLGTNGRVMTKLSPDVESFDQLFEAIQRHMLARPSPQKAQVEKRKGRQKGIGLIIGGVVAWALVASNVWFMESDITEKKMLKEHGVFAIGTITQKLIAPDGHTRRVYYRVDNTGQKPPEVNVEVTPDFWAIMDAGTKVGVIEVPGRPDITHLMAGQIDDDVYAQPMPIILCCAGIAGLGLLFVVGGYLSWRGIDIRMDSKGIRIVRIGE